MTCSIALSRVLNITNITSLVNSHMCLTELILYSRFRARQNFPLDAGPAIVADLGSICGIDEFPNIWSDIPV